MGYADNVSLRVNIDELIDKLEAMREDDYVTVVLTIKGDEYDEEMDVSAFSIEDDSLISYGSISGSSEEFI